MRHCLSRLGTTAVFLPAVAAALVLTGCRSGQDAAPGGSASGSASGPASGPATPTSPASAAPSGASGIPRTRLVITVLASAHAKPRTWTLTCDPTGGDLPMAKQACAALAKAAAANQDPFAPVPKGRMCTQIYGGPQVATVTGTWNGKVVNAKFNRTNGCEIKRWGDLAPLFGPLASPSPR